MTKELVYIIYARELKARDRSKHLGAPEGIPRVSSELNTRITEQLKRVTGVTRVHYFVGSCNEASGYQINGNFNPAEVLRVVCSNGCAVLTKGDYKSHICWSN